MEVIKGIFFVFVIVSGSVFSLQVVMDRASIVEFDKKYIDYAKAYVIRYGRKSPYYFNLEGGTKHTWNNNVTVHLIFYEYLASRNEYRRSFAEMHLKLCDSINSDPYVGKMLAKAGVRCPLPPGDQHLNNMTVEAAQFPNLWPFRKGKVEVNIGVTDTEVVMAKIDINLSFFQKSRKQ